MNKTYHDIYVYYLFLRSSHVIKFKNNDQMYKSYSRHFSTHELNTLQSVIRCVSSVLPTFVFIRHLRFCAYVIKFSSFAFYIFAQSRVHVFGCRKFLRDNIITSRSRIRQYVSLRSDSQ